MNKKKAIAVITKAARLYHKNLEDQKVLFIYGIPSEINKQIANKSATIIKLKFYEVAFHRSNFLHLKGVIINKEKIGSAINFYEKYSIVEKCDKTLELSKVSEIRDYADIKG